MKFLLASLAILSVVACGRSPSHNNKRTPNNTNESDVEGTVVVGTDGKLAEGAESKSPAVGVYLGSCEKQGSIGIASGVEITATEIRPVTAVFGDQTCAKATLTTFGYTGSFKSFAEYSTFLNTVSREKGDAVAASFVDTAITFASESGNKLSLVKTEVVLFAEKRLKVHVTNSVYDKAAGTVTGRVNITNSIFSDDQWSLAFYCRKDGKLVRQESSYTQTAGVIDISAKLNTWNPITLPTNCQVALAIRHGANAAEVIDIAYSQELPVN